MSARIGRPTSNPKQHRESYRLSDDDVRKLEFCTQKTGKTKTDIIRKGIEKVYMEIKVSENNI